MTSALRKGIIFACFLTIVLTKPTDKQEIQAENAVGYSTKFISTALLKEHKDKNNLVFSPLGYSTIFAILEEGSKGETEQELQEVLKLSKDKTRGTFKNILSSLKDRYVVNIPQLRTWFYVYKNFSVKEDYKQVLLENYLTSVKNVFPHDFEQLDYKENEEISTVSPDSVMSEQGNSPYKEKVAIEEAEKEYEALKLVSGDKTEGDQIDTKEKQTNTEIGEKNVEEKKIAEGDVTIGEENNDIFNIEGLQSEAKFEIDARKILPVSRSHDGSPDIDIHSLIIFNGLYFVGRWAVPFDEVTLRDFHVNENVTVQIDTVTSKGKYKMADLPSLNSTALLLPFENGRYSFLIILPWECNGLDNLVSKISTTTLEEICDNLKETEAEIEIPVMTMESTTRPESAMCKAGVKSLFKKGADLGGIAENADLHAEEIVQLVTLNLNRGTSSTNFMTAVSVRSREIKRKFQAKHPFLFFIEDTIYNVTMVAGKFYEPTIDIL